MKILEYPPIQRGSSLTIPIFLLDENKTPLQIPNSYLEFTLKAKQFDYDYDDDRALIQRTAVLKNRDLGEWYLNISSQDTWLPPGDYFFDIVFHKENNVNRLATYKVQIVGGPANRGLKEEPPTGDGAIAPAICFVGFKCPPIVIKISNVYGDGNQLPIKGEPEYLVKENGHNKVIKHYVARLEFPLVSNIAESRELRLNPFLHGPIKEESNLFNDIIFMIHGDEFSLEGVPREMSTQYFLGTSYGETGDFTTTTKINIPVGTHFIFHFKLNGQTFVADGMHCLNSWVFNFKWFDFGL